MGVDDVEGMMGLGDVESEAMPEGIVFGRRGQRRFIAHGCP